MRSEPIPCIGVGQYPSCVLPPEARGDLAGAIPHPLERGGCHARHPPQTLRDGAGVPLDDERASALREPSEQIRGRVVRARNLQVGRYQGEKIYCNAQMSSRQIRKYCNISAECERLLESAMTRLGLSARAHDRILKVARTIADLDEAESIGTMHISEAIQYRSLDRSYWT